MSSIPALSPPIVIAHRGASGERLDEISRALRHDVDGFFTDVPAIGARVVRSFR